MEVPLSPARAHIRELARLIAEGRHAAVVFVQDFERGLHAIHDRAIELHLFADMPVERARHQALQALRDRVDESRRARIHGSDAGHFRLGGVARVQQWREIGERDLPRIAVKAAATNPVANFRDYSGEFFTFWIHVSFSRPNYSNSR